MLDDSITRPLDECEKMQKEYDTNTLPLQDLCYCTYTLPDREKIIADVLGTDESEQIALLSYLDESDQQRRIWIAKRDQSGSPGTWLWTKQQQQAAKKNPVRVSDSANDFRGGQQESEQIQVAPIHKDRRIELLMLGLTLGKTDTEVQEQLRKEGLDDSLPVNYRTEQGEMELLQHWLPQKTTQPQGAAKAIIPGKSKGKKKSR